jgi:hypothetical protein
MGRKTCRRDLFRQNMDVNSNRILLSAVALVCGILFCDRAVAAVSSPTSYSSAWTS